MAKRPAKQTGTPAREPDEVLPPVPPPQDQPKPSLIKRIIGWMPGGIAGWLGLIGTIGTAIAVIYSFIPANLELALSECRPERIKLEVTNNGGQTATLGDARFEMISTVRFGDSERHRMDDDALENPIRAQRAIQPKASQNYEWLNVYQPGEVEDGESCHIYLTIPLVGDSERTFAADCACDAQ